MELTSLQRQYYRAVYEGQIGALLGGPGVKSLPGMRNLAMELRKLCCHPVRKTGLHRGVLGLAVGLGNAYMANVRFPVPSRMVPTSVHCACSVYVAIEVQLSFPRCCVTAWRMT